MVSQARQLVNDNAILQAHPMYAAYHRSLHDISLKDYPRENYFRPDISGIDLDQYEVDHAIANRDMTMDAMVGVADYSKNRVVNSRLLLVELRMDYDGTKHLRHSKLCGKINHSRASVGATIRVEEESVFVFREDVAEQAKRWMFDTKKEYSDAENWIAMSPDELENLLQPLASMPYLPETDMTGATSDMSNRIAAKDFEGLLGMIDYWHKRAEAFKSQYKLKEEAHIKQHLHDTWQQTKVAGYSLNMEQQAYVEMLEEDYKYLK